MKRIIVGLWICLYAEWALAFTIATGPNDGSYFQIAQGIKDLAGKDGIELQVTPTEGSFENIQLLGSGKMDLAFSRCTTWLAAGIVACILTWTTGHPLLLTEAALMFWLFVGVLAGLSPPPPRGSTRRSMPPIRARP